MSISDLKGFFISNLYSFIHDAVLLYVLKQQCSSMIETESETLKGLYLSRFQSVKQDIDDHSQNIYDLFNRIEKLEKLQKGPTSTIVSSIPIQQPSSSSHSEGVNNEKNPSKFSESDTELASLTDAKLNLSSGNNQKSGLSSGKIVRDKEESETNQRTGWRNWLNWTTPQTQQSTEQASSGAFDLY